MDDPIEIKQSIEDEMADPIEIKKQKTEDELGITQYISNHAGFTAILKQRYSDFLVNEVADGEVIRLTNLDFADVENESKSENSQFLEKKESSIEEGNGIFHSRCL